MEVVESIEGEGSLLCAPSFRPRLFSVDGSTEDALSSLRWKAESNRKQKATQALNNGSQECMPRSESLVRRGDQGGQVHASAQCFDITVFLLSECKLKMRSLFKEAAEQVAPPMGLLASCAALVYLGICISF